MRALNLGLCCLLIIIGFAIGCDDEVVNLDQNPVGGYVPPPRPDDDLEGEGSEALGLDKNLADRLRLLVENFEPVEARDLNQLVNTQSDAAAQVLRQWAKSG